jgi:septum formation protein
MTHTDNRIYLASRSPRRRELLKQAGIAFDLLLMRADLQRGVDVDEAPLAGEAPVAYVVRIASAKAGAGSRQIPMRSLPAGPVLAADTIVVLEGDIIGKPDNAEHARQMLRRLSGRTHQVLTAIAIAHGAHLETALSTSTVEFRVLEDGEIRRYIAGGEPLDKAGAYAIQGRAAIFVRAISGSYSGIMGLPLYETTELLRRFDINLFF